MADNLPIGTVIYSILEPNIFSQVNGNGWVLFDDRDITESELFKLTGMEKLPDARGIFIRGMNSERPTETGDLDQMRSVGSFQQDSIQRHTHQLSAEIGYFGGWGGSNLFSGVTPGHPMSIGNQGKTPVTILDTGSNLDSLETRPRNIALYVYIKINNE